ncbi:hypothetical protein [Niallia sp. Marseille-Q9988]
MIKMQVLLISIVCLLIITIIFVVFPSSMTIKGRFVVVVVAFVLSNIGLAVQYLYENYMISLGSLLLLVLMLPLLMQKSARFFFKEEIHSEYITTYTAKDMNKQNIELEEELLIMDKGKPALKKEGKITSNTIVEEVEQAERKPIKEVEFPPIKVDNNSSVMVSSEETENVKKQEEEKDWVYATLNTTEAHPKEDYWKNDNVMVRENSIEAFLEELNANKDNDKEEEQLEEIEEKPNRRYLERLEKIRILDNSNLPKDKD